MWKHAFLSNNEITCIPSEMAHEAHILKTASRLEELNAWVSQGLNPWECLRPIKWYSPNDEGFNEGISVLFSHTTLPASKIIDKLQNHKQEHESLIYDSGIFRFTPC